MSSMRLTWSHALALAECAAAALGGACATPSRAGGSRLRRVPFCQIILASKPAAMSLFGEIKLRRRALAAFLPGAGNGKNGNATASK
jgi:hypothetical protein